jgi:phosphoribosylanthranilate isomerase
VATLRPVCYLHLMADVKICGVKDAAAIDAALRGQAHFIGFNFFAKSPRYLSPHQAAGLARMSQGRADSVAVVVNPTLDFLATLRQTLAPDWIQLHGRESAELARAARGFAGKGIIRAVPIATSADLAHLAPIAQTADLLLFDAKAPSGADLPGGNGAAFDWAILNGFKSPRPWFLAGGLTPDNVADAIRTSAAAAVDVSSGVETAPGVKSPERIAAFIAAARSA